MGIEDAVGKQMQPSIARTCAVNHLTQRTVRLHNGTQWIHRRGTSTHVERGSGNKGHLIALVKDFEKQGQAFVQPFCNEDHKSVLLQHTRCLVAYLVSDIVIIIYTSQLALKGNGGEDRVDYHIKWAG